MSNETPVEGSAPTPASTAAASAGFGDPAPLGLAGFALTTLLLSFINAHIIKEDGATIVVLGLAAFYGGLAQFAAGLFEFRRGNTFGATAFGSFGAFWLSYWWIVTHLSAASGDVHVALGSFLLFWGIFTAYMTVAAIKVNYAVFAVFVLLTLTFVFLAIGSFQNGVPSPDAMTKVGGWFGIVTGVVAWYASAAGVINATHKRVIVPTGPR